MGSGWMGVEDCLCFSIYIWRQVGATEAAAICFKYTWRQVFKYMYLMYLKTCQIMRTLVGKKKGMDEGKKGTEKGKGAEEDAGEAGREGNELDGAAAEEGGDAEVAEGGEGGRKTGDQQGPGADEGAASGDAAATKEAKSEWSQYRPALWIMANRHHHASFTVPVHASSARLRHYLTIFSPVAGTSKGSNRTHSCIFTISCSLHCVSS